ncbi:hypothetical protein C8J57DRAFT_1095024, partial [Mycena rebaudengoi]
VLGGQPDNPEYAGFTAEAAEELEKAREKMSWGADDGDHCRGTFFAKTVGGSFGGGPQFPGNLRQSTHNHIILDYLLLLICFQRIAGFANSLLKTYNPAAHALYEATLDVLVKTGIVCNFDRSLSAFAAATFNFGPITITYPHLDGLNLAWGWCAITALSLFNPDRGGELILWDLKLVIRFQPGATILIPSAILRHSNCSIHPNETRYSFTQFSTAGLFRWVYNGFKSDITIEKELSKMKGRRGQKACTDRQAARVTRWEDGINSYMVWPTPTETSTNTA